jgi:hypothetical protein
MEIGSTRHLTHFDAVTVGDQPVARRAHEPGEIHGDGQRLALMKVRGTARARWSCAMNAGLGSAT